MTGEEALIKIATLGERRQAALDELEAVRKEIPRLIDFARKERGVNVAVIAKAVGVRRETIWHWQQTGDAVGWYTWDRERYGAEGLLPTLE